MGVIFKSAYDLGRQTCGGVNRVVHSTCRFLGQRERVCGVIIFWLRGRSGKYRSGNAVGGVIGLPIHLPAWQGAQ